MESVKQEQHATQLARGGLLDRFFKLTEHRTTLKTELLAVVRAGQKARVQ